MKINSILYPSGIFNWKKDSSVWFSGLNVGIIIEISIINHLFL